MKYQYLSFIFFVVVLFTHCSAPSSSSTQAHTKIATAAATPDTLEHVSQFYKSLVGQIDGHPITMNLQAERNKIRGTYFYNKVGLPLTLSGSIDAQNTFVIYEMAPNGDTTGVFKGSLKNEEGLSGTWTNTKTKAQFSFTFSERNNPTIAVVEEHYHQENCSVADSIKKLQQDSLENWYDTLCTSRTITLLRFHLQNKQVAEQIYSSLLVKAAVKAGSEASVEAMLGKVYGEEQGFEDHIDVYLNYSSHYILSVDVGYGVYYYGAAHPNSETSSFNYDLRNGKSIGLSDILIEGYEEKLERIAEKIFREDIKDEREFFLPEDFNITAGGLYFTYDPYQIGSYAEGYLGVFVPYGLIRKLIKPGSVLDVWLKTM